MVRSAFLRAVLWAVLAAEATDASGPQEHSIPMQAFDGRDECEDDDDTQRCALSALQLRGQSVNCGGSPLDAFLPGAATDGADEFPIFVSTGDEGEGGLDEQGGEELDDDLEEEEKDGQEDDEEEEEEVRFQRDGEESGDDWAKSLEEARLGITPWDKIPVTGCHNDTSHNLPPRHCPEGETCVVTPDGSFSQCMGCSRKTFRKQCQKLGDQIRYAAVRTCKQTCLGSKCFNGLWCYKPYRCITYKKEWGQCINCRSTKFWESSCHTLKNGMRRKVEKVCRRRCQK